jgi:hypothetical protein
MIYKRCGARRCASCGVLWAGDTRVKLLRNIEAFGGDVALVTVTAPGDEQLPRDDEGMVLRPVARRWNRQAIEEWRRMHRKAAQRAQRHARASGGAWRVIAREWEFQRRGVLHVHVVVPMATPLERLASQVYANALDELRHRHGFGYVDRGRRTRKGSVWRRMLEVVPQERAARYLAKYVAGVKRDGRLAITETVLHPDVPGHVVYVGRHLTRATGCTMRSLRLRRRAFTLTDRATLLGLDPWALCGDDNATDEHLVAVLGPLLQRGP